MSEPRFKLEIGPVAGVVIANIRDTSKISVATGLFHGFCICPYLGPEDTRAQKYLDYLNGASETGETEFRQFWPDFGKI